jgi:hypothetical protein
MAWLRTLRLVTFGRILQHVSCVPVLKKFALVTVTLSALIVMSISAQFIAWSRTEPSSNFFDYEYLALATSLATLFTVIPMCALDPSQAAP